MSDTPEPSDPLDAADPLEAAIAAKLEQERLLREQRARDRVAAEDAARQSDASDEEPASVADELARRMAEARRHSERMQASAATVMLDQDELARAGVDMSRLPTTEEPQTQVPPEPDAESDESLELPSGPLVADDDTDAPGAPGTPELPPIPVVDLSEAQPAAPAAPAASAAPKPAGRRFGRYQLRRRMASGGLSAVFQGVDTRDGSTVAVKVFKPDVTSDRELAWLAERSLQVTRTLRHPNLVRILEGGVIDGRRYSVMDHLEGRTLAQELAEGPMDPAIALDVLGQILEALVVIHGAEMAHRDLKPANVLLQPADGGRFNAIILDLDFLGPIGHKRQAKVRELLGTPKYIAPEDIHRGYPHPRSDLFSIGVMAYEMFTGREPFQVEKEVGYLHVNRLGERATPPSKVREGVPDAVDPFVEALLARQPAERYDALSALRDCRALQGALRDGTPVRLAGPPRPPRREAQLVALCVIVALLPITMIALWLTTLRAALPPMLGSRNYPQLTLPRAKTDVVVAPPAAWRDVRPHRLDRRALRWERVVLAERLARLPGQRAEVLAQYEALARERGSYRQQARARASALRERAYRELLEDDPDGAAAQLRQAIALASDSARQAALGEELAGLVERLARRRQLGQAPPGFAVVDGDTPSFVSRTLVSRMEYLAFLRANPGLSAPTHWKGGAFTPGSGGEPVVGVGAEGARRFAAWRGARLPRVAELTSAIPASARARPEWAREGGREVVVGVGEGSRALAEAGFRLAIDPGKTLKDVPPPKPKHRLKLTSRPAGAIVRIGTAVMGRTPCEVGLHGTAAVTLRFELAGSLARIEHVEPTAAEEAIDVVLYPARVLPRKLATFARDRDVAHEVLDLADTHRRRRSKELAHTLYMLVFDGRGRDYRVLHRVRAYLRTVKNRVQPALDATIEERLRTLEAQIDALRTRYAGSPIELWAALYKLGYDRHVDMVKVPAGNFRFGVSGTKRTGDVPLQTLRTGEYWIDRTEVTYRAYARFLKATGHPAPPSWRTRFGPKTQDHPVVDVSFGDALAYARWVGKTLPTEVEWEKAARGESERKYPYGQVFSAKRTNSMEGRRGRTVAVTEMPRGASPYGALHMSGNVSEWTSSQFHTQFSTKLMVIRGGSYLGQSVHCRTASRDKAGPTVRREDIGFRCVHKD